MSSKWPTTNLGAICKFTAGSAFKPEFQGCSAGDYPFIKVSDMNAAGNEIFINSASNYVNEIQRAAMKAKLHPVGAIVFAKIGVALTTNRRRLLTRPTIIDNNMMSATPRDGKVTSRFLYLLLTSIDFNTISAGTALPYLNVSDLERIEVSIPDTLSEQEAIARILGDIDDKIDLNRRINQSLEAMAQAIFQSWFVDFDPVKAKIAARAEGRDPLRAAMSAICGKPEAEFDALPPEQYEQLATIAALFPEEMETVAVVEVPKGWAIAALSTVCDLNANSWSAKILPASVKYVDLANTKNGEVIEVQTLEGPHIPSRARRILKVGDTIVGTVRPGNRSFALVGEAGLTGSTGFAVLSPKESYLREYVYLAATVDANIERLAHLADGGAYPAVRPELVVSDALPIPPEDLLREFHRISSCMLDQVMEVRRANKNLADLRDALLPRLLSGELSIEALAETAGAA